MTTSPVSITNIPPQSSAIFEGNPFTCRVAFTRAQNPPIPSTVVNTKTNLIKGDLFVINLNDENTDKLLMQVDRVDEERSVQGAHPEIFIDESIRRTFPSLSALKSYYTVQKVAKRQPFALYLVELQVKEQYFSRGDMWRFTRKLVHTVVYLKKALDIYGMRATVYGLWIPDSPYRVSSGYITKHTKIVFRSLSACCTIFLQMSKEMWEFDHHGDTYYEKAVDGFLCDLFNRWKSMLCQHDVTMTLFSRVFYDAKSINSFPTSVQESICVDHRGRFYEDFYRVIYQNERYDDWLPRLGKIKEVIIDYKESLLNYHKNHLPESEKCKMPVGTISNACDGNFLETLNLSSSVFERHFIDRSFDRLGQMSLIITPGGAVFEVDRELTNMTKQRVLDNGIGSDLVCLGEQPLFAVPLFKFFKDDPNKADDYQIPHWMNLSYYRSSTAPSCFKRYIPRLPFDMKRIKSGLLNAKTIMNSINEDLFSIPAQVSMEDYDNQIFRSSKHNTGEPNSSSSDRLSRAAEVRKARKRNITLSPTHPASIEEEEEEIPNDPKGMLIVHSRRLLASTLKDDPRVYNANVKDDISLSSSHTMSASIAGNVSSHNTYQSSQNSFGSSHSKFAQSAETYFLLTNPLTRFHTRPKALINPFAPASIRLPMVPGRRRWAHTFPIGPNKIPWHFHHLRKMEGAIRPEKIVSIGTCAHLLLPSTSKRLGNGFITKRSHIKSHSDMSFRSKRVVSPSSFGRKRETAERKESASEENRSTSNSTNSTKPLADSTNKQILPKNKKETIIWGPTGVEPWSASMITGIDWKSLTIPASLPTTFDVEPTEDELRRDFTHNLYELNHPLPSLGEVDRKRKSVPNGVSANDKSVNVDPLERQKLIFDELIDLRLSQGFQMINDIPSHINRLMTERIRRVGYQATDCNRLLSIGRIYHIISLVTDDSQTLDNVIICVQQFKPQHAFQPKSVNYKYRFQCPDSSTYDADSYELKLESLESFAWNIVDNAVCSRGMGDHQFSEAMKYWRTRLVVMPTSKEYSTKVIEADPRRCDCRQEMSADDYFLYIEHFIRFLLMLNKLARVRGGLGEYYHRPIDPVSGLRRTDFPRRIPRPPIPIKTFRLDMDTTSDQDAIDNLLRLFRDEQQGLPFVKDAALPEYSFVAIEAIWWSIEHCDELHNEQEALNFFQILFQKDYIRHCTHSQDSFRFGFFLYYIVTEKTKTFKLDSNDYAEVEFYQAQKFMPSMDYIGFSQCKPMRLLPKLIANQQTTARSTRLGASFTATNTNSVETHDTSDTSEEMKEDIISTSVKNICNVDVDQKQTSDRREWATAQYHAYYNPHCLFELEIRWLVATSCLLGELIMTWSQRTGTMLGSNQVAFHIVPIPCDPFAEFDPLRGPIYIEMDSSCLAGKLAGFSEKDQNNKLSIFQELILKRYGFILNSCVSYKNENIYYVHISGGMLVYIISNVYNVHRVGRLYKESTSNGTVGKTSPPNCGFYWCWNFCLGKKWRSPQTGEEKYQDRMLADFRSFCSNHENRLLNFWNEAEEIAKSMLAVDQKDN